MAEDMAFETIIARLEKITHQLEGGDLKLEEALGLFEEGMKLSKDGTKRLDEAEKRLEILLENDKSAPLDLNE
jgi:exodeoxyribonuclease VII small subunit